MPDLGSLGLVWSWQSFIAAAIFGFGFGYLVVASISAQQRWKTDNSARAYAWIVGVLAAWFLTGLGFTQAMAALLEGDPSWPRLISRIGPQLVCAIGLGFGTWRGLKRAARP